MMMLDDEKCKNAKSTIAGNNKMPSSEDRNNLDVRNFLFSVCSKKVPFTIM